MAVANAVGRAHRIGRDEHERVVIEPIDRRQSLAGIGADRIDPIDRVRRRIDLEVALEHDPTIVVMDDEVRSGERGHQRTDRTVFVADARHATDLAGDLTPAAL